MPATNLPLPLPLPLPPDPTQVFTPYTKGVSATMMRNSRALRMRLLPEAVADTLLDVHETHVYQPLRKGLEKVAAAASALSSTLTPTVTPTLTATRIPPPPQPAFQPSTPSPTLTVQTLTVQTLTPAQASPQPKPHLRWLPSPSSRARCCPTT